MKLGIITVTYNSNEVMAEFLHSVFAQTYTDWHLYVFDNNSTQNIQHMLDEYDFQKYSYVQLDKNYGFAKANNLAIRQALNDGCDSVLLINNDTVFDANLFGGLVDGLEMPSALICAPKILCHPQKNLIWYAGGYFDDRQALKNVHVGIDELDDGSLDIAGWQDFAPMCCVLITKEAFQKIGYLDENYFIYYEDADWMYRSKLAGIQVWYEPSLVLYHKVSSLTGGAKSKFTVYHATKSKIYFIKKFYSGCQRYYWLNRYFVGMFVGLLIKRYSWKEFKTKLRAFLS